MERLKAAFSDEELENWGMDFVPSQCLIFDKGRCVDFFVMFSTKERDNVMNSE